MAIPPFTPVKCKKTIPPRYHPPRAKTIPPFTPVKCKKTIPPQNAPSVTDTKNVSKPSQMEMKGTRGLEVLGFNKDRERDFDVGPMIFLGR